MNNPVTYMEMVREAAAVLSEAGIPDASLDARLLLEHVTGWNNARFFLHQSDPVPEEERLTYCDLIRRRADRIPLQHLTGEAWFMGLPFTVDERVLIPRQDTETLVELVLEWQKDDGRSDLRLLDLCTGSGCIAISLAKLGQFSQVTALDLSEEALTVAKINRQRNSLTENSLRLLQSDLFESIPGETFDVITANPPYITSQEVNTLMPEVRDHDPRMALDGGSDGLDFYRRLAEESPAHLSPNGTIFWEIGWDQGEAVTKLLHDTHFQDIKIHKDNNGNNRVVTAQWR